MAIRVMLVEDESGIRMLLGKILEKSGGFDVVAECDNAQDAIRIFKKEKPDVVFLDIAICGGDGLECGKVIADMEPKTKIIFATAHAEYMSEAFSVYAFDYLIKPFPIDRVNQTLDRIKELANPALISHLDKIVKYEKNLDKLLIKGRESISFIDIKEIVLVQRENNTTVIYTQNDSFVTSAALGEIEAKLDAEQFMRSHKSYIINVAAIKKIEPYGRWTYIVKFKDMEQDALITAEKYEEIKKRFLG